MIRMPFFVGIDLGDFGQGSKSGTWPIYIWKGAWWSMDMLCVWGCNVICSDDYYMQNASDRAHWGPFPVVLRCQYGLVLENLENWIIALSTSLGIKYCGGGVAWSDCPHMLDFLWMTEEKHEAYQMPQGSRCWRIECSAVCKEVTRMEAWPRWPLWLATYIEK